MSEFLRNDAAPRLVIGYALIPFVSFTAVVFAILGQYSLSLQQAYLSAIFFYAVALILWLVVIGSGTGFSARAPEHALPAESRRKISATFVGGAAALAGITFFTASDDTFTPDNVLSWVLSAALFLYALWEPEKSWADWRDALQKKITDVRAAFRTGIPIPWRAVLFSAILLLGAFFYYYRLDAVPAEMTSDHAEKILDIDDIVQGARPIFFPRNTGREPLQFYLTAAFASLTHHRLDYMALKWITASLGLLVVPFTFFLAREMFDATVGFIAAALVAVSKWPLIIARIGLRFPLTPFFAAAAVYFLFRALRYQKRNDFLMLGLILGAGLYGYNAFRIVPILVAIYFILWPLIERNVRREDVRVYALNALLVVLLAVIVFVPLLRYTVDHPDLFWYRTLTRVASAERPLEDNPLLIFADNVKNALLMFNVTGDVAWPNNIPLDPALDFATGGLFVLGVAAAVYRLIRYRETMYGHLLTVLFILLMPSALSIAFPVENPGNARAGGAIPFVLIVSALPLALVARAIQNAIRPRAAASLAAFGAVALLFLFIARVNFERYFVDYNASYRDASWNSSEVAAAVRAFANSVGDTEHAWILLFPHWVDTRNVAINLGEIAWQNHTLENADAAEPQAQDNANKLYILNPKDGSNLARLQEIFPSAQIRIYHSRTPNHDFVLMYVPGTEAPQKSLGTPGFENPQ